MHFAEQLAMHLADVKNTDARSRIIRSEVEQKVEALTRMCFEMHATVAGLSERLPGDLRTRVENAAQNELSVYATHGALATPEASRVRAELTALLDIVAPKPEEPCEHCGETECPA